MCGCSYARPLGNKIKGDLYYGTKDVRQKMSGIFYSGYFSIFIMPLFWQEAAVSLVGVFSLVFFVNLSYTFRKKEKCMRIF